mmetsp:Transcript_27391/g.53774  ORF Transcript_27391/g.53774 Transcript_27391/m.53774 type:complete len:238 (+) Transcript_27391:249-962(+)
MKKRFGGVWERNGSPDAHCGDVRHQIECPVSVGVTPKPGTTGTGRERTFARHSPQWVSLLSSLDRLAEPVSLSPSAFPCALGNSDSPPEHSTDDSWKSTSSAHSVLARGRPVKAKRELTEHLPPLLLLGTRLTLHTQQVSPLTPLALYADDPPKGADRSRSQTETVRVTEELCPLLLSIGSEQQWLRLLSAQPLPLPLGPLPSSGSPLSLPVAAPLPQFSRENGTTGLTREAGRLPG